MCGKKIRLRGTDGKLWNHGVSVKGDTPCAGSGEEAGYVRFEPGGGMDWKPPRRTE